MSLYKDWRASVHHDGSSTYIITNHPPRLGEEVAVRLRVGKDAPIKEVYLRTCPDGEQAVAPMHLISENEVCRWWEGKLKLHNPSTGYRFLMHTDEGTRWYTAAGIVRYNPTDSTDFKYLAGYHAPAWVKNAVFYQIFPDRFADGDPTNNVKDGEYLCYGRPVVARKWGEAPHKSGFGGSVEFFGGDLQGITQKLEYLRELGVTALYLNPIFTSPSNHKYDVAHYKEVDPHLGGEAALIELRNELERRDMHLMLDLVPNHTSYSHPWFTSAQENPLAETAEFFTFREHPNEYESWLGVRSLPKLNYRSEKLRQEMFAGEDSIIRYWLRPPYSIDAWRVDVANMMGKQGEIQLGHKIGRAFRRAMKEEFPDSYLLGEHFHDGTPHLQGQELDASMNYQGFTFPVWRWLSRFEAPALIGRSHDDKQPIPGEVMAAQWEVFKAAIPWQIVMQQFNLLGSHDTSRIFSILGEDEARLKVAATMLLTYPGVPCIYYGDEIGMTGEADPDCRRCMEWDEDKWHTGIREHYQSLIQLRKDARALREGGFQLLLTEDDSVAYMRETPHQRVIVVAQRTGGLDALSVVSGGIADGSHWHEFFTGEEATIAGGLLTLNPSSEANSQIWIEEKEEED